MKQMHLIIHGQVQGVFFRDFICKSAAGLTGWVRNNSNGTVEVIAEGDEEKLKKLLESCKQGPSASKVENIDVKWEKATGEFSEFKTIFI
ncbi:acylphosphatase [Candidatus Woesearchaeota archaeon]|nr:acylphosphatase [Candidatus Woesearchaeota archaeon]MBW3006226.1 acylphosphatase [Candidatus Woesearchaeota archaeon]